VGIVPGSRCQIISVHHRCFNDKLGRVVVVVKVFENSVLAHDDKPLAHSQPKRDKGKRLKYLFTYHYI
jgi:hypothetical protein